MLFMDNASHHKSEKTREFAQREDIDIELLYNIPYRCDFNPCEQVYRLAKYNYKKELEIYKAHNADDRILRTCLKLKAEGKQVVLYTNDRNLANKSIISGIKAYE